MKGLRLGAGFRVAAILTVLAFGGKNRKRGEAVESGQLIPQ